MAADPVVEAQLALVQGKYPGAETRPLPSGAHLVSVPDFCVWPGWSANRTLVRFLAPMGYPFAAPDCFWASDELRLANGEMPQSSALNPIPETEFTGLWFSWHLTQGWNPNVDSFLTWLGTIDTRFQAAR